MTSDRAPVSGQPARASAREERRQRLAELLRGALAGRRDDLDRIVAELTPMLWRVARSHGADPAMSEDVVQTTWLTLLRHLDSIRSPEALASWLITVTRREAVRVLTSGSREQPVTVETLEPVPGEDQPADEALIVEERRRVLWRVLRQLPRRCQQLLEIVAFCERPDYARVAAALDMPKGSIGPTRGRCLAKLRTLLLSQPDWSRP